ncbi:MAG: hypothetical protein K2X53_03615, partial [Alphaproteobacteria bacterium]|nr:hypothetical protein [Alphaproteobacteria bacterium]
ASGSPPASPMVMEKRAFNAPLLEAPTPYPLIVLSHGYGGSREHLSWIAEGLSKHGFVVASLEHYGNTAHFDTPSIALQRWIRPLDVTAFLDQFLSDSAWKDKVDATRIGFSGFSLGGLAGIWLAGGIADKFKKPVVGNSSLYELARDATQDHVESIDYALAKKSYKDQRIKAAFLMAPAHGTSFGPDGLSSIHIPIFIAALEGDATTPLQQNAAHYQIHIKGAEIKVFKVDLSHVAFRNGIQKSKVHCVDAHEFQVSNPDGVLKLHQDTLNLALNFFKNTL